MMNAKEKLLRLFSVSTLLALLPFFSGLQIYLGNLLEFTFTLPQYVVVMGVFCVGLFVFWSLLQLCFFRTKIFNHVVLAFFALGVCAWIQGSFLLRFYGDVATNRTIPGYLFYGILEILIYAIIASVLFYFRTHIEKKMAFLSVLILVSQILVISPFVAQYNQSMLKKYSELDTSPMFQFSKDENVLFIVVDSLSDNYFRKITQSTGGEVENGLKDFEHFTHLLSRYPQTYYALPTLLSGSSVMDENMKWNVKKRSFEQTDNFLFLNTTSRYHKLIKESYTSPNSMFHAMSENGYRTEMYPFAGITVYLPKETTIISNLNTEKDEIIKKKIFTSYLLSENIIPLAIYRISPFLLKRKTEKFVRKGLWSLYTVYCGDFQLSAQHNTTQHNTTQECLYSLRDELFFQIPPESAPQTGISASVPKCIKVIHLWGLHGDADVNAETPELLLPIGCYYFQQGILPFLERMKKEGSYDNSWIFILGDHGNHFAPVAELFNPPLLVKRPGASQEKMTTNEEYVFMRDIAPSLLTEMGIQKGRPFSIWNLTDAQKEERKADWKRFVIDKNP